MAFRVGQKVVCVSVGQNVPGRNTVAKYLKQGAIYTIRELCDFPYEPDRDLGPGVRLEEVYRSPIDGEWEDYPFSIYRFRPLTEKKTDISVFTAMLNTSKQGQDA